MAAAQITTSTITIERQRGVTPNPSAAAPRRSLWKRVALALSTLVAELLLLELLLALFGILPPEPRAQVGETADRERKNFVADPGLGWRMRPGTSFRWRTEGREFPFLADADGFRIDEREGIAPPPLGAPRIALVGDSFTFGTGVTFAQSYGAVMAERLGAVAVNRAQPGFGVDQIWQACERVVFAGEPPDLLVVGVILDDFERSLHAYRHAEGFSKPRFRVEAGRPVASGVADNLGAVGRFLEQRSRVWTMWKGADRRFGQLFGVGTWWSVNAACLDALLDGARARGVRVLVVHIATVAAWRPFPALAELVAKRAAAGDEVLYCDLAAQWRVPPLGAYYEVDGHLTADGHAALAAMLVAQVSVRWQSWPR
ncbi:MAG: SGNH/GDSL hydrolase family protein [Planctomycetes bacterium]|nr:SGNH/GDSL hydrolase family protein [Planctomycetota bacterium]